MLKIIYFLSVSHFIAINYLFIEIIPPLYIGLKKNEHS